MKLYEVVLSILYIASILIISNKYLWVVQQEHYIPFSLTRFIFRWVKWRPINIILICISLGFVIIKIGNNELLNTQSMFSTVCFLVVMTAFPYSSDAWFRKLVYTKRVIRLMLLILFNIVFVSFLLINFFGVLFALNTVVFLVLIIIDFSVLLIMPLEKKLQKKFIKSAQTKLNKVSPSIVAITGSYGKTSTKVYVKELIGRNKNVCASAASFNNLMGLSKAVNETLMSNTEIFVAEMGTYGKGEIAKLCSLVKPEVAVITAIGPMHLERMKSLENILEAKKEIMRDAKVVVVNISDPLLKGLPNSENKKFITVSEKGEPADVMISRINNEEIEVKYKDETLQTKVKSTIHLSNLGCAIAVALYYEIPLKDIVSRIVNVVDPSHRRTIEVAPSGVIIIDDTFNLNPKGALADLDLLTKTLGNKKILVTPGMVELGKEQFIENKKFIKNASDSCDVLLFVGYTNKKACKAALEESDSDIEVNYLSTREEAVSWIRENAKKDDVVLYANDLPKHYP